MKIYNIDGPDGVGKSTLVNNLLDHFINDGKRAGFLHFPRYDTAIGTLIREALFIRTAMDPKSLQMLYSADRLNFTRFDVPKLEKEFDVLIVDRYNTSGLVYGRIDEVPVIDLLAFERETKKVDLNLILLATPETVMSRMKDKNKDMYENLESQRKALAYYKEIHLYYPNTIYIDANESPDSVLTQAVTAIEFYGSD